MTDRFSLSGQVALILGGSGGIGRALALAFKDAGATTLVAGRSAEKLKAAADALGGDAGDIAFAADLQDVGAIRRLADDVASRQGVPDILINCQGTTVIKPALEVSEAEYDTVVDTNMKSVFFACQAFGGPMVERGSGAIINIASLASHSGWANASAYAVSKWGVAGLTKTLAAEWGKAGVRVNAIAPGFFLTDLNRERASPERKAEAVRRTAMGRMGEVDELAGAALFLASDASRFVSGEVLCVDGGYLASGI